MEILNCWHSNRWGTELSMIIWGGEWRAESGERRAESMKRKT